MTTQVMAHGTWHMAHGTHQYCESRGVQEKKRKTGVPTYYLFLRFFEIFRSGFRKYFYGVFGLLMQRNGQKRDKKKFDGKRRKEKSFFFSTFSAKSF
jgi:hypothetical protein